MTTDFISEPKGKSGWSNVEKSIDTGTTHIVRWRQAVWLVLIFDNVINLNVNQPYNSSYLIAPIMLIATKAAFIEFAGVGISAAQGWWHSVGGSNFAEMRRYVVSRYNRFPLAIFVSWLLSSLVWSIAICLSQWENMGASRDFLTEVMDLPIRDPSQPIYSMFVFALASFIYGLVGLLICAVISFRLKIFSGLFSGRWKFWIAVMFLYASFNGVYSYSIRL